MDSCKRTRYNSSSSCLSNASAVRRSTEAILKWENDVVDKSRQFAMGLDVGGSLAKVAHFEPDVLSDRMRSQRILHHLVVKIRHPKILGLHLQMEIIHLDVLRGTLHFLTFQSCKFEEHVDLVLSQKLVHKGGGAHKYEKLIREKLELRLKQYDELQMLILGMDFLIFHVPDECYYFEHFKFSHGDAMTAIPYPLSLEEDVYPYLVVNIGSGVSIMSVEGEGKFRRVGGTALGGATFFGLTSLLCPTVTSFNEALELANRGNNANVDLLVKDIYGGEYKTFSLKGSLIAAAFGKLTQPKYRNSANPEDLALATLVMISSNVGAISHLQAEIHHSKTVMFTGSFLRNNKLAMRTLTYYTDFMAKGKRRALFLRHDGYFGAIGALLQNYAITNPLEFGVNEENSEENTGDVSPLSAHCPKLSRWLYKPK
eukprot:GSMAST32.ASY1.ANO1.450.1 assembled CDS